MKKIVQCVPNISEGRDLEKVEKIIAPLKNKEGFKLVSYEPDNDHNRTVITLVGDPEMIVEPLVEMVKLASELIDLNTHQGEHPRMGAIDVIPFVPIRNITLEECVTYAEKTAELIWNNCNVPTFLYAEAAKQTKRKKLPTIRKGQFEGMKEKIKQDEWKPDFGNAEVHPQAGVTAVGARVPLVAYNINLDTDDVSIASKISRAIRFSSGGFRFVQAGPMELKERGIVQVSMNILDYRKTSIYRVFETVKMEAARYGVNVIGSEVIGVVPLEALAQSAEYYLKIEDFSMDKILESSMLD